MVEGGSLAAATAASAAKFWPRHLPLIRAATSVMTSAAHSLTSSSPSSRRLTIAPMTSKAKPSPTAESAAATTARCQAFGSTPDALLTAENCCEARLTAESCGG